MDNGSNDQIHPNDPNLGLAQSLKAEGKNNIEIRKILKEQELDDEYISAIILAINPEYKKIPRHSDSLGSDKKGKVPVWSIIVFVLIILRIIFKLVRYSSQ